MKPLQLLLASFVFSAYYHVSTAQDAGAAPPPGVDPKTDPAVIKVATVNQGLYAMDKGPYLLPQLQADMKDLKISELNMYRGPILSHLGEALMNVSASPVIAEGENGVAHTSHHLWKNACHRLYTKALNSANGTWPPPPQPPDDLRRFYTLDNRIPIVPFYIHSEHYNGGTGYVWEKAKIDALVAQPDCDCGQYQTGVCDKAIKKYESFINGKVGIVVGSETPWAEAVLIKHGATQVATIEYMPIKTDHPQLKTYHPAEVASLYLAKGWDEVDFAFIYSSVEHDGLGRYGDPMNPFADLESVGRTRCLLKHGGILFLGFPTGPDAVAWNAHRIYGRLRLFLIFQGFEIIDMVGMYHSVVDQSTIGYWRSQPVFVLRKI
jgi:hypothetical protein